MTIDWANFTPGTALAGGVLLGFAAVLLLIFNGRIAGISGVVGGLLQHGAAGDKAWRLAFVLGIVAAPLLYQTFAALPEISIEADWATLVAAGLLVGFGSRRGSGCTSGHGVCGLSRLSPRSLVATLSFMATGFATVYVVRHLLD